MKSAISRTVDEHLLLFAFYGWPVTAPSPYNASPFLPDSIPDSFNDSHQEGV